MLNTYRLQRNVHVDRSNTEIKPMQFEVFKQLMLILDKQFHFIPNECFVGMFPMEKFPRFSNSTPNCIFRLMMAFSTVVS